MEKTFLMIKPDGVQRGLVGEIVKRFEAKGFKMLGMKLIQVSEELAGKHYGKNQKKMYNKTRTRDTYFLGYDVTTY